MITSWEYLALTQLAGITIAGLIMCSALSSAIVIIISVKKIFRLCSSFNFNLFKRQQWYKICPYMGSFIIWTSEYSTWYSLPDLSCTKSHSIINVWMYGAFGLLLFLMKSISFAQHCTSMYLAGRYLGDRMLSLPFNVQRIAGMNVRLGYTGRLHHAILPLCAPKSITGLLLPWV